MGLKLIRTEAAEYGRRSGIQRRSVERWCIEGEHLTVFEIAVRLKVSSKAAGRRLREARAKEGPVTWARLRGVE